MSNDTVVSLAAPARVSDPLTELLRTGARRLIEAAVTAEFEEYLSGFVQEKLPDGRQRVVRNGHLPERKILTGLGEVDVRVPKSRSRSGSPEPFRSSVVPPYVRRCASLDAAIPWLYLHGVSTGQMRQAVGALVDEEAARGLSANVVSRLKRSWDEEYRQWCRRRLDDEWVYLWADGIYSGLRGERERLCVLVVIGVNARGEKHFLAIEDGVRESTQSWREVLLGMKQRGFTRTGEARRGRRGTGVLGGVVGGVSNDPNAALPGCTRPGNVLNCLPEVWPGEGQAGTARDLDGRNEGAGRACLRRLARALRRQVPPRPPPAWSRDRDELLAFYDFPAAHWTHLRTTNVIESAFATIRHRSSRAKGCVTRQTMLSMIYKMGRCAEKSWRRLRGFRQLAKVIEGVKFNDGIELIEDSKAARMTNSPYTRFDNSSRVPALGRFQRSGPVRSRVAWPVGRGSRMYGLRRHFS